MSAPTLAEIMAEISVATLRCAQRLEMRCMCCGKPIEMFCCGWTLPLSSDDKRRALLLRDQAPSEGAPL